MDSTQEPQAPVGRMSRGQFLRLAAGAGAAAVLAGRTGLAGASAAREASHASLLDRAAAATKPRRGGTLRLGWPSGGSLESFNPQLTIENPINYQRMSMVYDLLVNLNARAELMPGLASRIEPNAKADEYLIELRNGIRWHDGSPLTSEDVAYSLNWATLPKSLVAPQLAMVDVKSIRTMGRHQLRVPLHRPYARLAGVLGGAGFEIIKAGTKSFAHPIGTGAFKVASFVPGQRATFVRNPDYWNGPPHVDGAELLSFNDPTAQMNALLGGEVDVVNEIPGAIIKANASNASIKVHQDQRTVDRVFVMRVDKPPFNDVRVRQAFKLIADRPALLEDAQLGYGVIANDILGKDLFLYDDRIPQRKQDIEQAKHLLKKAGRSDLHITIDTSDAIGGMSEAAVVFAQQAAQAGVSVKINKIPPAAYFTSSSGYLKYLFSQDSWPTTTFEGLWDQLLRTTAPENQTHWSYPNWDNLMNQAEAELDTAKAMDRWAHLQQIQYDQGGYLNAVNVKTTGAYRANVHGAEADWSWMPTLNHAWLS